MTSSPRSPSCLSRGATMQTLTLLLLSLLWSWLAAVPVPSVDEYEAARRQLIDEEACMRIGGTSKLNANEQILNQFIMKEKRALMQSSRLNRTGYFPATSFYLAKEKIESSAIFKIIKAMPKGAALHLHDLAIASVDWVVDNATYRDNVYYCVGPDNFLQFHVFNKTQLKPGCNWTEVKAARANSTNRSEFDLSLKKNISMLLASEDPLQEYPTVDLVWDRFNSYFGQVINLLYYAPIMRDYYRQALEEFRKDNVQYIELRSQLYGYYELDGVVHDAAWGLNMYREVTEEFIKKYPDFTGANIIFSSLRVKQKPDILTEINMAVDLYKRDRDYFLGYDLVGQEDPNYPLHFYLEPLLSPQKLNPPVNLPYFFHAGETKWQGTDTDYNLVDALLMNTTRIGHGYALAKHPKLVELVKKKGVAVEVCPISNQLLGLVNDVRNHPIASLIAQDVPIVFSSDDPGTWNALPLSHDIYVAFMDLTGEDADLSFLKQVIRNSLVYSSLNSTRKEAALNQWSAKWDKFVTDTIKQMNLTNTGSSSSDRVCPVIPVTPVADCSCEGITPPSRICPVTTKDDSYRLTSGNTWPFVMAAVSSLFAGGRWEHLP